MCQVMNIKMAEIDQMSKEELENTDRHDFLTFMLTRGGLKMSTIVQNTIDLLFAGIDTVNNRVSYFILAWFMCIETPLM